eukprot:TRINITY_DN6450_c0_g2_i3.p1 TRINITY_DN6450_c0_g2~~TRINITY_DN6450_c0_g2_i3.p1  ORF type:complete len:312 (+),score=55.55 TRINITY_DN6450_c0_g2_i3:80-1015(+)
MSQSEKDSKIQLFVSMAPPFLGAGKALQTALGGDPDFVIYGDLGLHLAGQRPIVETHGTMMDLLPSFTMHLYKDQPWLNEILQRSQYETKYDPTTPDGQAFWQKYQQDSSLFFKFFPTPLKKCVSGFTGRREGCFMFIYDALNQNLTSILGKDYGFDYESIMKVLETYSMKTKFYEEYAELRNQSGISWLTNPGVSVALVYYSHLQTPAKLSYNSDPRQMTQDNSYYFPENILETAGDSTVPNYSSLLAGFKWAFEFDQKAQQSAKPVKILEVCSTENTKKPFYDTNFTDQRNDIRSVSYTHLTLPTIYSV